MIAVGATRAALPSLGWIADPDRGILCVGMEGVLFLSSIRDQVNSVTLVALTFFVNECASFDMCKLAFPFRRITEVTSHVFDNFREKIAYRLCKFRSFVQQSVGLSDVNVLCTTAETRRLVSNNTSDDVRLYLRQCYKYNIH